MSLSQDLDLILDVVNRVDPSFATVAPGIIDRCVEDLQRHAARDAREEFLLSAMQLLALPGNGHTRLIPNDAISVLPLRFVTIGTSTFLTKTSSALAELPIGKVIAVNGRPVAEIELAAAKYLAGTRQRQRVIGPLLLAWPAALARLGFAPFAHRTEYHIQSASGQMTCVKLEHTNTITATEIYPRNEHGQADPVWNFKGFADVGDCSARGLSIALPSFFDPDGKALSAAIERAATFVRSHPGRFLVIDVRGNTGGDFLETMPLIDAITECAGACGCAVLVDKFTFSAAIVFVALLKYRLGSKLKLVGEEMGDGLRFFAEGDLIELPISGAFIRYSSALHDWETGSIDETTPPEIARQIVPVLKLDMDRHWVADPFDTTSRDAVYGMLAEEMA
ncbi:peptidase S41 [Rhodobacteraceae bacterium N5(2021)]|uniref:Peptidase S41 n=1 Tax=Gymnodinialimonas phycosphaerae TaxID=2841589 RepID=A0A975YHW5_9RHOB|nr:peptidase S41 [Gymnodinialimonas phycosphaerae]MBY4893120.1 peptidase S41 [Gymnodinialimonas phycosphaerae]